MSAAEQLRTALLQDRPIVAPGVFNAMFAKLVEDAQFSVVYHATDGTFRGGEQDARLRSDA